MSSPAPYPVVFTQPPTRTHAQSQPVHTSCNTCPPMNFYFANGKKWKAHRKDHHHSGDDEKNCMNIPNFNPGTQLYPVYVDSDGHAVMYVNLCVPLWVDVWIWPQIVWSKINATWTIRRRWVRSIQSSIRDQEPSKRDRKGPNEISTPDSQNWITSLTSAGWIVARRRPAPHPAPLGHMHLEYNPDVDVRGSVRWISIKRRLSNQKGNVRGFNPVLLRSHAWAFTFGFARGLTFIFIAFL